MWALACQAALVRVCLAAGLGLLLAGLLLTGVAQAAEPLPVRLSFEADAGCPPSQAFLDKVAARAAVVPSEASSALYLEVALHQRGSEVRGRLRADVEGGGDVRELGARS